jgi:transcription antitermination factor NusG
VAIARRDRTTKGGEALLLAEERDTSWYAIWTRSNCERLVAEQLTAKGFTPFLPEMGARSRRNGKTHVVQVPMFPGYLFLRHAMEKHSYIEILKARGVVRILERGWSQLTPVADEEVDAIQRLVASGMPIFPHAYFREGDRVRVVDGPLAGMQGVFVRDKPNKGRLVVSVNLLQTSVAVEVDCAFVEALPVSRPH